MGFELFEKGSAPRPTTPSVTIQKRGLISINLAAFEMLGKPEAVELLWDGERRAIAIRAAKSTSHNAYLPRAQGKDSEEKGPWLIAGTLFTQHAGLDTSEAHRWVPTLEDGLLVVDVSQPGSKVSVNRKPRKVATAVEDAVAT